MKIVISTVRLEINSAIGFFQINKSENSMSIVMKIGKCMEGNFYGRILILAVSVASVSGRDYMVQCLPL